MTAVVATSHPLAVEAGLDMLRKGGTAADAAVAAGAVLAVVDPRSTGIGGDVFALYWASGANEPIVLAGSGGAPKGLDMAALRAAGHTSMPIEGPWTVTVPGVPAAWFSLSERFGKLGLGPVLDPAIGHARDGFVVTPMVADEWAMSAPTLKVTEAASSCFLPGGVAPSAGDRFANPDLAGVLDRIRTEGPRGFYEGEVAERIATAVRSAGGPFEVEDLSEWAGPTWEEPIRGSFRGLDIFQTPPPGQGLIVIEALALLEHFGDLPFAVRDHVAIESLKLAFKDAHDVVADPRFGPVDVDGLLAPERLVSLRGRISIEEASVAYPERGSDTVYVAVVDHDGNCCSFIQSLYYGFGSGVGVEGTGIVLQNRGAGFTFSEGHPNAPAPGKRPFHTIIPSMVGDTGTPWAVLGVVGGYMQPQGQLQILRNLLDDEMEPQAALDAPRFRVHDGRRVALEPGFGTERIAPLLERGHEITDLSRFQAGGAQLIRLEPDGRTAGATDPRKDGIVGLLER